MLSINQLNAKAKLLEVWKALNLENYPLIIKQQLINHPGASQLGQTQRKDPVQLASLHSQKGRA